jgi:hypothetical protein
MIDGSVCCEYFLISSAVASYGPDKACQCHIKFAVRYRLPAIPVAINLRRRCLSLNTELDQPIWCLDYRLIGPLCKRLTDANNHKSPPEC